jgi:hypothetical protein
MALSAKDYMSRIGRTPEQQKYFDASGNVNSKYSSSASQQNPKPIYSFTPKTAKRGGGFTYGNTVNVYKKDKPVAAAPAQAAPAPAPAPAPTPPVINNPYTEQIDALNEKINTLANTQNTQSQTNTPDFSSLLAGMQANFATQLQQQQAQQDTYLNNLKIQQETRMNQMAAEQKAAAERLATGQRTYQQNEARASQIGALQIGGAAETPRAGGTQGFKRRKLQINPATANSLAGILGGTAGSKTTNTLNV